MTLRKEKVKSETQCLSGKNRSRVKHNDSKVRRALE
jgi:hypothetical protein